MAQGNGQYTIEKKIPFPKLEKYPLSQMQVGDSFFFKGQRHTIAAAASIYGKRNAVTFSVRKDGDGFRCWRTS